MQKLLDIIRTQIKSDTWNKLGNIDCINPESTEFSNRPFKQAQSF